MVCRRGWPPPQIHYVALAGLKVEVTLLPQSPKDWDYRHAILASLPCVFQCLRSSLQEAHWSTKDWDCRQVTPVFTVSKDSSPASTLEGKVPCVICQGLRPPQVQRLAERTQRGQAERQLPPLESAPHTDSFQLCEYVRCSQSWLPQLSDQDDKSTWKTLDNSSRVNPTEMVCHGPRQKKVAV